MTGASNQRPIIIKRKVVKGGGHHGGAWKVAYADFVTAMMAFFLLMWLINATSEEQKGGIADYFSPSVPMSSRAATGDSVLGGDSLISSEDLADEGSDVAMTALQSQFNEQLDSGAAPGELTDHLLIEMTPDGLVIQIVDKRGGNLFSAGSAAPTRLLRRIIAVISPIIAQARNRIGVSGHTDASVFPSSVNYDNWVLSSDRAIVARRLLIEGGVNPERFVSVEGKADADPISPDPLAAENRRVAITLYHAAKYPLQPVQDEPANQKGLTMGISSSMNASTMGLAANAERLSGISNNIANSQTVGYKRVETEFASLVNAGNSRNSYEAGGVRPTSFNEVSARGSLLTTGSSTDLAINGRGLLPVTTVSERNEPTSTRPFLMTSTGSFTRDDQGYLSTASGLQLLGWPTDADGNLGTIARDTEVDLEPVNLLGFDLRPTRTTSAEIVANLPSAAAAGDTFPLSLETYDALGNVRDMLFEFVADDPAAGAWSFTITDPDGTVVGAADVTFGIANETAGLVESVTATTGTYDAETGALTIGAEPETIEIMIGQPGSGTHLTQYSTEFTPTQVSQDGAGVGFLRGVEITPAGVVEGIYDTGVTRALYRIPVVDVPNPDGLSARDVQTFEVSKESGGFFLWDSGDGPTGQVIGYSLEQSTTDITNELTSLIVTQRAYSSNAKIIQTVDEMLQETNNLKR